VQSFPRLMRLVAKIPLCATLAAVLMRSPAAAGNVCRECRPTDTGALLRAAAKIYGLDPALLSAIAITESGGYPDAVSPKGAEGLMQLMPATAERFGVVDPFDPVENVLGAARFLNQLERWRAGAPGLVHLPELIAAYNAGPGSVERYGGVPPYPETRRYVRRVLWRYFLGRSPPRAIEGRPAASGRIAARDSGDLELLDQLASIRRRRSMALGCKRRDGRLRVQKSVGAQSKAAPGGDARRHYGKTSR
jgi:Transglycosylase SLT domain